ncbi:MAG: cellobiose phosphorylase [Bacteroidales bacterium]|nr:cellobiose phosphorylase [Bacteroidales bacterium]MCF8386431.1 cellobiose phosphorylase [Bacteroidales bacterium]MCF8397141.1 cellobiose phosphorylase [Bacteroidales bacterium]
MQKEPRKNTEIRFGGIVARNSEGPLWKFTEERDARFISPYANKISRLYFPLMNQAGMKSYVTPDLKGDICTAFDKYLSAPLVTEEIHRNKASRNFRIVAKGHKPWSVAGLSAHQIAEKWSEEKDYHEVEGRPGEFTLRRRNNTLGLLSETKIFIPSNNDPLEIMLVKVTNEGKKPVEFKAAYSIPVFGRSADNFRDHRQVTSMFQKTRVLDSGISIKPSVKHDESGHQINTTEYSVFAFDKEGIGARDQWALMEDFIGEGGSLLNPEALALDHPSPEYNEDNINGKEAIAAFRWDKKELAPGESEIFVMLHCITESESETLALYEKYKDFKNVTYSLSETRQYWEIFTNHIEIQTSDNDFDNWIKWIIYQVKCRQIFGNSYLPDFGYGRGGRGWRDLWQDLLAIFLVEQDTASNELLNNLKGIRIDGSNATIIGTEPGTFKADRNNIARYWSDHGAWPLFVLNFYIDQTGDLEILLKDLPYWKDQFSFRTKEIDKEWDASDGNLQLDVFGKEYRGSVFEHVLLQNLSSYYHVGEHNNLLLEGADWNDTYDMARERGESVCFHHFYGFNLKLLAELLQSLKETGIDKISLLEEIDILLDTQNNIRENLTNPGNKQAVLNSYLSAVKSRVSGKKKDYDIGQLINDLLQKSSHVKEHIQENEWITTKEGRSFFNGHYDNHAHKIDGDHVLGVRMDLPSQVMPVMCETATQKQIKEIIKSTKYYLKDDDKPGLRLCTDFKELDLNIGRLTGFTYGYKEHGSKWMQQNIMLAYGLYKQKFVNQGFDIINETYTLATDSAKSRIFPGLPSFFEPGDRGAYAYLTGSSTWFMLTLVQQIFGVKGKKGDLFIEPKLSSKQFDDNGEASIKLEFAQKTILVKYMNTAKLAYGEYAIEEILFNDNTIIKPDKDSYLLKRDFLQNCVNDEIVIKVLLSRKQFEQ